MDFQSLVHYSLHFIFPIGIAWIFFRKQWKYAALIILSANLIDLDHLLATPIFDAQRCSIGFHPLHSFWAIGIYVAMGFLKKTRILAIGLLFHIFTDLTDCIWTFTQCYECYVNSRLFNLIVMVE